MLFVVATFVGVLAVVFGAYWALIAKPEARDASALQARLTAQPATQERLQLLRQEQSLSQIQLLDTILGRFTGLSAAIKGRLDESGLQLNVGAFVLGTLTAVLASGVVVQQWLGLWWVSLIAAAAAGAIPWIVVGVIRARRLQQFEEQFPEAIELIARSLRAGHAFATGLKIAADEMPAPTGPAFKLLFERQNFGAELNEALRQFAASVPLLDARFFVTAVLTQRETGGNLSEVLDRLASVMRERFKVKREVRVRSAHGRLTAYVLAGLPPTLAALMMLLNPDQMRLMFTDPLGLRMLAGAVVLQVIGTVVVRRLVNIEY